VTALPDEVRELWLQDPEEVARQIADALSRVLIHNRVDSDVLSWLLAVSESAADIGLLPMAVDIAAACRQIFNTADPQKLPAQPIADLDGLEGLLALKQGRLADAERLLLAARAQQAALGDRFGEAISLQNLAAAFDRSGRGEKAREAACQALRLHEALKDRYRQAQTLVNLASYAIETGSLSESERYLDKADSLSRQRDASHLRTSILGLRARLAGLTGNAESAGILHRRVLRRARRNGDIDQVLVASQNLGAWYAEQGRPRLAARWLEHAAELAELQGNLALTEELQRAQAVQLARSGQLEGAVSRMRSALSLGEQLGQPATVAQGQADLAASLINLAIERRDKLQHQKRDADDLPKEAESLLVSALEFFRALPDHVWAVRVLTNYATLDLLRNRPASALNLVTAARDMLPSTATAACAELDRRAASIAVGDARQPELAADFVRHAAECVAKGALPSQMPPHCAGLHQPDALFLPGAAAWELALGASAMSDYPYALAQASTLFQEAADAAMKADYPGLLFHISNDLALVLVRLGDNEEATQALTRCLDLANRFDDRVMRQQALANLGELARRQGDSASRILLAEAAELAEALDDRHAQVSALANLALAEIGEGHWGAAERAVSEASVLLAREDECDDLNAQLIAATGAIVAGRGDYETARGHYLAAARICRGIHRVEYRAGALAAMGRTRDRRGYLTTLGQLVRDCQREDLELEAARTLLYPARVWLDCGSCRPASRMLAVSVELSLAAWGKSHPERLTPLEEADREAVGEKQVDPASLEDTDPGFQRFAIGLFACAHTVQDIDDDSLRCCVVSAVEDILVADLPEGIGRPVARMFSDALAVAAGTGEAGSATPES
jgi:tetratricopeptide (TPR) repeat protein